MLRISIKVKFATKVRLQISVLFGVMPLISVCVWGGGHGHEDAMPSVLFGVMPLIRGRVKGQG